MNTQSWADTEELHREETDRHVAESRGQITMVTHAKTFTHIVRRADILGGEPIVAGTRIPVRTIVQYAQIYNDDLKEMEGVYPSIARADIEEALAFYEANREEIDRYIAENEDDASQEGYQW